MEKGPKEIETPHLKLNSSSTDEYCRAIQKCSLNAFWAYQERSRILGRLCPAYQDSEERWWYEVRHGFCWPADIFTGFVPRRRLPIRHTYLGYQHIVPEGAPANSSLAINAISNLKNYGVHSVIDKRRAAIRKGLRMCEIVMLDQPDPTLIRGAKDAWNSLVGRTAWKHLVTEEHMIAKWTELLDLPATSILLAIEKTSEKVAGFLITKIFADTAYVDTIASNSDLLKNNPNDALMYTFLRTAAQIDGVTQAHYAVKSTVTQLERFKTGLGFEPVPRPAIWWAPPGIKLAIRLASPGMYKRLNGTI